MVYSKIGFGFLFILLLAASAYSQTASAIFKSENAFQLTINNVKQQNNYSKSAIVYKLSGDRPYNLKIEFEDDTLAIQNNIYIIDEGLAHIYDVSKEAIQLKKVVPSASYFKTEDQFAIVYLENTSFPIDTIKSDTIQTKDTTYVVPFASYYELKDYNGRVGCPFPINEEQKSELRGLIIAEKLEESKLEKIKTAIIDIDSACVLIDQIKELTSLFEYEETRLDFTKFIATYTFDLDNYEKLYPLFNFDNSKDELKLLFKQD
jgi:hypothetical protein